MSSGPMVSRLLLPMAVMTAIALTLTVVDEPTGGGPQRATERAHHAGGHGLVFHHRLFGSVVPAHDG